LLNNTDIRVDQSAVQQAKYNILGAYQPFDPLFSTSFGGVRNTSPTTNQLQTGFTGPPTLSTLTHQGLATYSQTFQSGAVFSASFNVSRTATNSSFYFLNPFFSSGLSFSVTQPLLRNRGLFPNQVPIVIARRNLEQSRAAFEAQVNNLVAQAVGQYWAVVGERESLTVSRSSIEQAEATYRQNKRALELGALPPLDIYRSEAEVAQRRVNAIQAEYALKQAEDQFRQAIGADLDPYIRALDLELVENPAPQGGLFSTDEKTAQEQALQHRPEMEALRQQLANDETSVRLAHNALLPDLELNALYASNGIGGNQLNSATTPPTVIPGGFGDALSQLFGFGFPAYSATLTLTLPIRNRGAKASLGRAEVARRNDLYLLRRQVQVITLDVANAVHQLEQAKLSMAAAKVSRDLQQKNLEGEQRKYELGGQPIFFVLDAQRNLATAEESLVQAEIGYQLALTAVDRATGNLLARFRVQVEELTR
jgi:outer membrane protein TolC